MERPPASCSLPSASPSGRLARKQQPSGRAGGACGPLGTWRVLWCITASVPRGTPPSGRARARSCVNHFSARGASCSSRGCGLRPRAETGTPSGHLQSSRTLNSLSRCFLVPTNRKKAETRRFGDRGGSFHSRAPTLPLCLLEAPPCGDRGVGTPAPVLGEWRLPGRSRGPEPRFPHPQNGRENACPATEP